MSRTGRHGTWSLAAAAAMVVLTGAGGQMRVVREIIYPSEFEVSEPVVSDSGLISPPTVTPTAFKTREVGVIFGPEATVAGPATVWMNSARAGADLIQAAAAGEVERVRLLAAEPGATAVTTEAGMTPLMAAAGSGQAEAVQMLLDSGAALNATSAKGHTALMYAASHGRLAAARALVERGANVNLADAAGRTALLYAVNSGSDGVVQLLLERGAAPNRADRGGLTPLKLARARQLRLIEFLLAKAGATQ